MSTSRSLNSSIVSDRKARAPRLVEIVKKATRVADTLNGLQSVFHQVELPHHSLLEDLSRLSQRIDQLIKRAKLRAERFESGRISIAIGGIEKSGKTTLLKTLTGIDSLPTANERCTAVSCQIVYDHQNTFDLEYHTDESFTKQILQPLIEHFNAEVSRASVEDCRMTTVASFSEFRALVLPAPEKVRRGTKAGLILEDLINFQKNATEIMMYLGRIPKKGVPLHDLPEWVANSDDSLTKARVSAVSRCIIYTAFDGGSPELQWIDTPGVDDPSPLARKRTLETIGRDADLLVVATMPQNKPSPTEPFYDFWGSIQELEDEIPLLDRFLLFLNWHRSSDPERKDIESHRSILIQDCGLEDRVIVGPSEAISLDDVSRFMERVNAHLQRALPSQDDKVIQSLDREFKSVFAEIRTKIYDVAMRYSPSDSQQRDQENLEFNRWFDRSLSKGDREGFLPNLRAAFVEAVKEVPKAAVVVDAQANLTSIFNEKGKEMKADIPKAERIEALRNQTGASPTEELMQTFASSYLSGLANDLTKQVAKFGPVIQEALLAIFRKVGLGPLLVGDSPQEALKQFTQLLHEGISADEPYTVLETLDELATLSQSLQYIYRWQMRPSINFLSPLHWASRNPAEELASLLEQSIDSESQAHAKALRAYYKEHRLPGPQSSNEEHAKALEKLCTYALLGIRAVLNGDRCKLENVADDFIRDFQTRLSFSDAVAGQWRELLSPHRGKLLGEKIAHLRERSENLRAFHDALKELDQALS